MEKNSFFSEVSDCDMLQSFFVLKMLRKRKKALCMSAPPDKQSPS
ncbi:hypothetical protein D350_01870 [Enterococcus faecalis VC1B-1]|nr:hypothetical protein HMPREF1327_01899 [Enterococcus faecalis 599]EPH70011.1 hypothetical protein D928_02147 [Enterococcus faecalis 20-SD-BW-06]EPI29580.1 hypothetical protein D350_01870 [Enterococcus faecalis VC1B-1]